MPENKKLLSDYQKSDCSPSPPRELDPSAPCPTCIPDPNFILETDWWNMKTGWLDEKVCEYKFNFNVKLFDQSKQLVTFPRYSMEWKALRDGYAIDLALRALLKHFGKLVNDDTLKELKLVTVAEEEYLHPEYDIEALLISLPALNFDMVPEAPLDEEELQEETEDASTNLDEIILEGSKLYSQIQQLSYALTTYEFFYSAFHQVKKAVISEKDNPINRISYSQAKIEIREFRSVLNSILWKNKFKKLRLVERYSFARQSVDKIKIVFETDDNKPFNIKQKNGKWQVFAKAKDGCGDWVRLENSYELNKYTQSLAFLSRIEDIMIDLSARETKPWMEFTLEYFWPLMTVDYGLASAPMTDDQKSALACLLEKELGLGKGKALDSLISNIITPLKVWANKEAKNACKKTEDRIENGSQAAKDKEPPPPLTKREEMILRFQKDMYNDAISNYKKRIKETTSKESPTENDALKLFGSESGLTGESNTSLKRTLMSTFRPDAVAKYETNEKSGTLAAKAANSPFLHDMDAAVNEKVAKEMSVVNSLQETFAAGKEAVDERSFQDFLNVFGICGVSKVTGTALECLLGGVSLDTFLSEAIRKVFDYMEISVFIKFYNSIPMNVRMAIDEAVGQQFGSVNIGQLLGFMGEQQPSANLKFVSGAMNAEINQILEILEKYSHPSKIKKPEEIKSLMALQLVKADGDWGISNIPRDYYSHELSSYLPAEADDTKPDIKAQNDKKRELKKDIRGRINSRDKDDLDAAEKKFNQLVDQKEKDEIKEQQDMIAEAEAELLEQEQAQQTFEDHGGTSETIKYLNAEQPASPDSPEEPPTETPSPPTQPQTPPVSGAMTHDKYATAIQDYEETNIGVKIDKLVGAIFVEIVESLLGIMPDEDLWDFLRQFPVPDMVINTLEMLFKNCPSQPLFHPPPKDFLKTLKVDICDPTIQLTRPKINLPNLDWKYNLAKALWEKLDDILMDILKSLVMKMLMKVLDLLDGAVCKALEALGRLPAELIEGKDGTFGDAWYKALDKAFCGDDEDDHKKSKDLTNSMFNADRFNAALAANIISSVAGQDEILSSIIAEDQSEQDGGFNTRVSNAINALADDPELLALLGTPSKVGYFMMKLGSFLPNEDKDRIRALLDEGVPNLPLTSAICLTDDQLEEWNRLRNQLLRDKGLSPEDAQAQVNRLNGATEDALGDLLDMVATLQNPGGPFLAPVQDWYGDNRYPNGTGLDGKGNYGSNGPPATLDDIYDDDEPCQDGTPIKDQISESEMISESDAAEESFKALTDFIKKSFFKRGGLFNEALRDTEGRTLTQHGFRVARETLWSNYANSEEEWDLKYNGEDTGRVLKAIMKIQAGEDGPAAQGVFPQTVGLYLKEQLQAPSSHIVDLDKRYSTETKSVNSKGDQLVANPPGTSFPKVDITLKYPKDIANVELKFVLEEKDEKPKHKPYEFNIKATFNISNGSTFDYYSYANSRLDLSQQFSKDMSSVILVEPSSKEIEVMKENQFVYGQDGGNNLRGNLFSKILNNKHSNVIGEQKYEELHKACFDQIIKSLKTSVLEDPTNEESYGFRFGYISDNLTEADFDNYTGPEGEEYTYSEEDRILGKYGNDRIKVLSPETYGGKYSNPPIYVEPMAQDGWLNASDALFGGIGGCEPKTVGAMSFRDIKDRGDKLKSSMSEDKRLAKDPDCVAIRPFNTLLMVSSHVGLEKSIRSTVRTYASEGFVKGLGVFGNLLITDDNYDSSVAGYIISEMKETMTNLGSARSSRRIRIKRQNYWYTFLEQTVQCYQRMIDIDGLKAPPHVAAALEDIYLAQKDYRYPTKSRKRKFWSPKYDYSLPGALPYIKSGDKNSYNLKNIKKFYHDSIAFRVYQENMFYSTDKVDFPRKRFYSLRKLRFFTKIFTIRLVEEQCKVILAEIIKSELRIMATRFENSKATPSYYKDIRKAFLGIPEIFPESTLKIGTAEYDPQSQTYLPGIGIGDVPYVQDNNLTLPMNITDPSFIIEKYVKLVENDDAPYFIKNRADRYKGIISADVFEEFKSSISPDALIRADGEKLLLSDCFGNLEFTYKKSMSSLFWTETAPPDWPINQVFLGASHAPDKQELVDLNFASRQKISDYIDNYYLMGDDQEDFDVLVTDKYLRPLERIEPAGTTGTLGISYGLRISVVPPFGSIIVEPSAALLEKSLRDKAYLYSDGNVLIPLVSSEYSAIDETLEAFQPDKMLNLECLVDKITADPLYSLYFDKIFGLTMITSMMALYCSFGFLPALGKGTDERSEDSKNSRKSDFDGISNKSLKQYLRREFSTYYLSNDLDGQEPDDSDKADWKLKFNNPFRSLEVSILMPKLKLLQKLRLQTDPYDSTGEECVDPLKDLF